MKTLARIGSFLALTMAAVVAACSSSVAALVDAPRPVVPEIDYLKKVNAWRPVTDPQLLFILMSEFANAGRSFEGYQYFEQLPTQFGSTLSPAQRAQYMIASASLRMGYANDVPLLKRIGWVKDSLAMIDEANRMTDSKMFLGRWMSGIVRSRVPGFLGERDRARADLQWCIQNVHLAPHVGWLREVYFALAQLDRRTGKADEAARYQSMSGYAEETRLVTLTSPFSEDVATGHAFSPKMIREVVPDSVYVLSGFEFTEFYFIITADRKQLVAIDAGTRSDSAKAALDAIKDRVPDLPPLTTVFVTHAHWDHVGGQAYFREAFPDVKFIGRANYRDELQNDASADIAMLKRFFGSKFDLSTVLAYHVDTPVDKPTELTIGGTRFALAPTRGGETNDAMLINMPDTGVMFVGDIMMPYIGAPFVDEGSVDGMLAAMDQIGTLHPRVLLHGHEPLTRIFTTPAMLADLRGKLAWLEGEVVKMTNAGAARSAIHEQNLIPPGMETSGADVDLAYLVLRENMIDRLIHQNTGYWQSGIKGLDHLSDADRGALLTDYLGISEDQIRHAAQRMMADGRHELAASTLQSWHARNPSEHGLDELYKTANMKLAEKYQEFNPFKFIIYSSEAHQPTAQMDVPSKPPERGIPATATR